MTGSELPAPRKFRSVREALKWFSKVRVGPKGIPRNMLDQSVQAGSASTESQAVREVTHAAICACVRGLQHGGLLVEWTHSFTPPAQMARAHDFPSEYALRATMKWTERELAERMRDRGLLEQLPPNDEEGSEDECPASE